MSAGEVLVFILMIIQVVAGMVRLTVRALTKLLESYVGQPAAGIILGAGGVVLAILVVRAVGRRLARWRGARRLRSLHGSF